MSFEINGTVYKIGDTQTLKNDFTKRDFVIRTDEQYAQILAFELVKDKTAMADKFKPGDAVKVSFDVRGREWEGRFFTNLSAWRIEPAMAENSAQGSTSGAAPMPAPGAAPMPTEPPFDAGDSAEDDLPF